jgi:2-polyprenyl-3-methyl-5-hydroxy-6-metoxy-1,4-benzoquinol methylase
MPLTPAQYQRIEQAMRATYFQGWDPAYLESDPGRADIRAIVQTRYDECLNHIVPWIDRHRPLKDTTVIEIGCGSGSSTCAIAHHARAVFAYDIDQRSVDSARLRADIIGHNNITFRAAPPGDILTCAQADCPAPDLILLYAVLEHQHPHERLDTLRRCWGMLPPGGLLVIVETPNRLCYFDAHTSLLPFFSMLPAELAIPYAGRSPRSPFAESITAAPSPAAAHESLARWGRGVSFHEFELAIPHALNDILVGDGYDPEVLALRPSTFSEQCLLTFFRRAQVPVPEAFARQDLDLILRKPAPGSPPPPARTAPLVSLIDAPPNKPSLLKSLFPKRP